MRLLLLVAVLCFSACGGGNDSPPVNSLADRPFVPDFSNPEGATDAFARAIEDQDIALMETVLVPEEREASLPNFRRNFESTREHNGDWRLEFEPGSYIDDNHAVTRANFIQIEHGKDKASGLQWVVFKKVEDGTWRYSPAESKRYAAEVEALPKNPPEADGADSSADPD